MDFNEKQEKRRGERDFTLHLLFNVVPQYSYTTFILLSGQMSLKVCVGDEVGTGHTRISTDPSRLSVFLTNVWLNTFIFYLLIRNLHDNLKILEQSVSANELLFECFPFRGIFGNTPFVDLF